MKIRRVDPSVWTRSAAVVDTVDRGRLAASQREAGDAGAGRVALVRRYLKAFFANDLETASGMVTKDFVCQLLDLQGQPLTLIGFEAVREHVRERTATLGATVTYELIDFLAGDDLVAVAFREHPPVTPGAHGRQLALWRFRGDLIASVSIYGLAAAAPPPAAHSADQAVALSFIDAWIEDDTAALRSLSHPDIRCRWVGFHPEPLEAVGLSEILRVGRGLERSDGPVGRVRVLDQLDGREHVAVLLETPARESSQDRLASLGVYRIEDGRVHSLVIFADRLD